MERDRRDECSPKNDRNSNYQDTIPSTVRLSRATVLQNTAVLLYGLYLETAHSAGQSACGSTLCEFGHADGYASELKGHVRACGDLLALSVALCAIYLRHDRASVPVCALSAL